MLVGLFRLGNEVLPGLVFVVLRRRIKLRRELEIVVSHFVAV